jgi:RNA polymerase sigma factor (sigma-70 family)
MKLFEKLISPHLDGLFRLAYFFTNDRDEAEDLLQDVLFKLYKRQVKLAEIESLKPWLGKVLFNYYVDQKRRNAHSPLHLLSDTRNDDDTLGEMPSERTGPESFTAREYERTRLMAAFERLSPDHQIVLQLHDVEGHTLIELEEILGVSLGTLKSRLHRARNGLRNILLEGSKNELKSNTDKHHMQPGSA